MIQRSRQEDRLQLRLLDGCLQILEDGHERDEATVSEQMALTLRSRFPAIVAGMRIAHAMDLVMQAQTQYMNGSQGEEEFGEPLDVAGARTLTDQIKTMTRRVCLLLLEARRRRAWLPLGYQSWEQYVRLELGFSRSRSYELLDQGRIIRALMAAAGVSGIPDVSTYAAQQIKETLPEVIQRVRERCAGASETRALHIVAETVDQHRSRLAEERQQAERAGQAQKRGPDIALVELARLCEVIENLTSMPPVNEVIGRITEGQAHRLARLETALGWLTEFAIEWRRQERQSIPSLVWGVGAAEVLSETPVRQSGGSLSSAAAGGGS